MLRLHLCNKYICLPTILLDLLILVIEDFLEGLKKSNLETPFVKAIKEGTNLIKIENSTINFVDKLILSDKMGKRYDYRKNTDIAYLSIIDDPSAISCKNSSINDGNLAFILSTCDDFGENLDEFALREYEKTFIPDNTIYRLSR